MRGQTDSVDRATVEDARCAEGWSVRREPNRDGRVAPKGRTRYFLFQPSLPLIQATSVRGAFGATNTGASRSLISSCLFLRLLLVSCLPAVRYLRQNLSNFFYILIRPWKSSYRPRLKGCRGRYFPGLYVTVKGDEAYSQFLGSFGRGVSFHSEM